MTFHLHSRHVESRAARSGTRIVAKEELVARPRSLMGYRGMGYEGGGNVHR